MKLIFQKLTPLILSIVLFPLFSFAQGVRGDGNVVTETRPISFFSAIAVSGSVDVYLSQEEEASVMVEADENLQEIIQTEVKGNTLYISERKNIRKAEARKVYVGFRELTSLIAEGATDIYGRTPIRGETLEVGISGASDVTLEVYVDELICRIKGAADGYLSGEAIAMIARVSGSSDLEAGDLISQSCQVEASGASDAFVHATESLDAKASGSSDIEYRGNPPTLRKEEGNSSDISSRN
ncbi:MAG: head GIN domain-containing protein [Bacteroidota bacterium]